MKYIIYLIITIFSFSIQAKETEILTQAIPQISQKRIVLTSTDKNRMTTLKDLHLSKANMNHGKIIGLIKQNKNLLTNSNTDTSENLLSTADKRHQNNQQKSNFQGTGSRLKSNFKNLDLKAIFFAIEGMPKRQVEM